MKKFSIPCDFGGKKSPFDVFIGNPKIGNHPLLNQSNWLQSERGGTIPPDIWESFAKLLELSEKNGVPFEDLCAYALEKSNAKNSKPVKKIANTTTAQTKVQTQAKIQTQAKPKQVAENKKPQDSATNNNGAMKIATAKIPASQVPDSDPNKKAALQQAADQPLVKNKPQPQATATQQATPAVPKLAVPKPTIPKPATIQQAAPAVPRPAPPKPATQQAAPKPIAPQATPAVPRPAAPKPVAPKPAAAPQAAPTQNTLDNEKK